MMKGVGDGEEQCEFVWLKAGKGEGVVGGVAGGSRKPYKRGSSFVFSLESGLDEGGGEGSGNRPGRVPGEDGKCGVGASETNKCEDPCEEAFWAQFGEGGSVLSGFVEGMKLED